MPDGAAPPRPYQIGAQVGFLLRRAHQRHTALFAAAMTEADLTPTQFNALVRVSEHGSVTQNHLGRLCATDPATIQGVVRRLLARDLVERRKDPADRRTAVLVPTEAGRALAEAATRIGAAVTEATLAPLAPHERDTLLTLLGRIS